MIRRSGLKNNMVAELKGIQPATLSRHKSGDIGISLGDAEEYAKILNCTPQQIFFASPPIPVLACVFPWDDECGEKAKKIAPHLINSNNGKNPTLVMGHSGGHMERMAPYQDKALYMHDYYKTIGCYKIPMTDYHYTNLHKIKNSVADTDEAVAHEK